MALNKEYVRKIEFFINNITKRIYKPVDEFGFEGFFTYDRYTLDEAKKMDKQPIPTGLEWGKKWEYGWFFANITIPECCAGQRVVFAAKQGESIVYVNDEIYGAFDKQHSHITLAYNAKGGETFEIAMEAYAGHSEDYDNIMERDKVDLVLPETGISEFPDDINQRKVINGTVGILYEDVFQFWMDINTLYSLRNELDENSWRQAKIDRALKKMCDAVNIELPMDEFLVAVKRGREILKPELDAKNGSSAPTTFVIGHSHLDLEWLWTDAETRRKAARTLGNQLKLIEEYPEYKYIQSQPWILETVKNEFPDLYAKVKKAVADGNIIVEGGMYVEADVNTPTGESFVRQFIYGKKFIKEEFGKDSEILWHPDVFGISGSLPQIMKKCGIKYFMSAKLMWQYNGGDPFPHSTYMWRGIDGSEILTHFTSGYAEPLAPPSILSKWKLLREKGDVPVGLISYGHGDGGGGATRIHLENLRRERDLEGMPKLVPDSPNKFFETIVNECEVKEEFVGELYYAAHRGTHTTQAKTKKLNRKSELALRDAEIWSALSNNDTKAETDKLWKTVLFNQFHDILPGTSLTEVHQQTEKDFTNVINSAGDITTETLKGIVEEKEGYITVFNSLSWARKAFVELPDGYTSMDGCETQKVGNKVFALVELPAMGYKSFKIGKDEAIAVNTDNELILENNLIKAEFNKKGELISIIDKATNMEYLSKQSNQLKMYQDMTCFFDAWDIDSYYENQEVDLGDNAEASVEYKGELESSIIIKKKINESYVTQRAILRKDSKKIDFVTEVDWRETHKLLKVDFNTNIHTDEMVSETQYGYVKRPNHKTRQYDADRYEVCNQKWSALCETKRGVAVLNDCKYGISSDGGRMSLTLLRSTVNPARFADKGIHNFTYSILPFGEALADSVVVETGFELNCPVIALNGIAEEKSLINVSEKNIIVDAIKFAEDGSGDVVVRLYDCMNTATKCSVEFGFDIKEAYITNMLEEEPTSVDVKNNQVQIDFGGFEVITLKLKR